MMYEHYRPNDKPVLLMDQDEPMSAWVRRWFQVAGELGLDLGEYHIEYYLDRYPSNHLSERDKAVMEWIVDNAHWYDGLEVVEGAQEGVAQLEEYFDIWICTKPSDANPSCMQAKLDWIKRYFPSLRKKMIPSHNKAMVRGEILLDDAPELDQIPFATWKPVVFTCPFNGSHSKWADLPHFRWGDDIQILLDQVK